MDSGTGVLSTGMTVGLIALAAALIVASVSGLTLRRRAGRFRPAGQARTTPVRPVPGDGAPVPPGTGPEVLTGEDLGAALGPRATLVQFSTAFCAPCRPTRQILAQVAGMVDGVTHVDVDAAERMDLVHRLKVNSTPTVLVLGPDGAIVKRASGLPRKADVIAAVGTVIGPDAHQPGVTAPGIAAPAGGE
jgi:thiol-disulfide isomerase/thioredoxin